MKVDLSCPVEVRSYELYYDDAGRSRAAFRLFNLTESRVCAIEAVALWKNIASENSIAQPFAIDRIRAEGRSFFGFALNTTALAHPDAVEILFHGVRFESEEPEWRAGYGLIADIPEAQPLSGVEANLLYAAAGADAVRFAASDRELWHCVCGRDNPAEARTCRRCGRALQEIWPACSRESLLSGSARAEVKVAVDDVPLDVRLSAQRGKPANLRLQKRGVRSFLSALFNF